NMIEESIANATNGVSISDEVATTLHEIAGNSNKVDSLVAEITAASSEQAQGIEQINAAVTQLNSATEQNAANAEEFASASQELNGMAEELRRITSAFTFMDGYEIAAEHKTRPAHSNVLNRKQTGARNEEHHSKATKKETAEDIIPLEKEPVLDF
ncbi:MAG: methyl-accepting chemotaxis protein, partial [Candidatus Zixiibacteriota bacterium]